MVSSFVTASFLFFWMDAGLVDGETIILDHVTSPLIINRACMFHQGTMNDWDREGMELYILIALLAKLGTNSENLPGEEEERKKKSKQSS